MISYTKIKKRRKSSCSLEKIKPHEENQGVPVNTQLGFQDDILSRNLNKKIVNLLQKILVYNGAFCFSPKNPKIDCI